MPKEAEKSRILHVDYDPDDGSIVVWERPANFDYPRLATYTEGKWHPNILFTSEYMTEYFRQVRDPVEIDRIMSEAEDALNESVKLRSSRE